MPRDPKKMSGKKCYKPEVWLPAALANQLRQRAERNCRNITGEVTKIVMDALLAESAQVVDRPPEPDRFQRKA